MTTLFDNIASWENPLIAHCKAATSFPRPQHRAEGTPPCMAPASFVTRSAALPRGTRPKNRTAFVLFHEDSLQRITNKILGEKESSMTTYFDQKNQNVKNQTNVAGNLNVSGNYVGGDYFANAQNPVDVVKELEKLLKGVTQAADDGQLDEDTAVDVESNIKKAITRAKKPEPDKTGIIDYLTKAKGLIESVTTVSGLVTAVTNAVEAVREFF